MSIVVGCRGRDGNRLPNPLEGHVGCACLAGRQAECMQRVGVVRLQGQDLLVDGLRLLQVPRLMILRRDRQRFGNRYRKCFLVRRGEPRREGGIRDSHGVFAGAAQTEPFAEEGNALGSHYHLSDQ